MSCAAMECCVACWKRSFVGCRSLRIDPEAHNFILTEPPLNTPENREYTAEIMFETFNVPGLYIGVQAVLALYAGFAATSKSGKVSTTLLHLAQSVYSAIYISVTLVSLVVCMQPNARHAVAGPYWAAAAVHHEIKPDCCDMLQKKGSTLTGTVVDSGDGVTHVIPVADGYVIGSNIKSIPVAGRDITLFVQQLLR